MFKIKAPPFFKNSLQFGRYWQKPIDVFFNIGTPLYVFLRLSAYGSEVKIRLMQESGRDFKAVNESP
jgi:hypothetical protein